MLGPQIEALLDEHQFYDACIVGGADSAIARAAYGRFDDALRLQHLHAEHYLAWAIPFHEAVRSNVASSRAISFTCGTARPSIAGIANETRA